jgi:hypothetical protein
MSALFAGDAASSAVLGLLLWIVPLIAVAAKLTYDQTRNVFRSDFPQNRSVDKGNGKPADRPRDHDVMHERFKAKVEAMIWPD